MTAEKIWIERLTEQSKSMTDRILSAAQSRAVWSDPVTAEGHTIITASEVSAGGGFGVGFGRGPHSLSEAPEGRPEQEPAGGGGGGGGGSMGRPVAIVTIGPEGVRVRPVVDVTKIALAGLTAWGAILLMLVRLRRGR